MAGEKRHLPIVSSKAAPTQAPGSDSGDDEPPRPPWHWIGFGVVAIFGAWLPLAWLAARIVRGWLERRFPTAASAEDVSVAFAEMAPGERASLTAMLALPHLVALALAAFAGGYLVGRWGEGTTRREPALAGLFAGLVACVLTFGALSGFSWAPLIVPLVAAPVAFVGGNVGRARRERRPS